MSKNVKKFIQHTKQSVSVLRNQWLKKIAALTKEKPDYNDIPKSPEHPAKESMVMHLSGTSVAKATLIVLLFFILTQFVYEIRNILLIFFVALLFSAALDPTVTNLEKKHIPRGIGILLIYLLIFSVIGIFISNFIPLVASQTLELANRAGEMINSFTQDGKSNMPFVDKLKPLVDQFLESADKNTLVEGLKTALETISKQLQSIGRNTWNAVKFIFNGVFNFVFVLVITFFMTLNEKGLINFIRSLFPKRHDQYIIGKVEAIKSKIGSWLRGQVMLSLIIGIMVTIGLTILKVEYAATLGMIAAITEFIPYLGPIIAAIPSILIAFNQSPWLALWVAGMYYIIQLLENNAIVPLVMRQAVGLSPIIIIFAMMVGAKFLGVLGIILAVPVTTIAWIFVQDYTRKNK